MNPVGPAHCGEGRPHRAHCWTDDDGTEYACGGEDTPPPRAYPVGD